MGFENPKEEQSLSQEEPSNEEFRAAFEDTPKDEMGDSGEGNTERVVEPEIASDQTESNEQREISPGEALFGAVMLGLKIKKFWDSKKDQLKDIVEGAKTDIKDDPGSTVGVLQRSILSFGATVAEHERELAEKKLTLKQQAMGQFERLAQERQQTAVLEDAHRLHDEVWRERVVEETKPKKRGLMEADLERRKAELRANIQQKMREARGRAGNKASGLLSLLG